MTILDSFVSLVENDWSLGWILPVLGVLAGEPCGGLSAMGTLRGTSFPAGFPTLDFRKRFLEMTRLIYLVFLTRLFQNSDEF